MKQTVPFEWLVIGCPTLRTPMIQMNTAIKGGLIATESYALNLLINSKVVLIQNTFHNMASTRFHPNIIYAPVFYQFLQWSMGNLYFTISKTVLMGSTTHDCISIAQMTVFRFFRHTWMAPSFPWRVENVLPWPHSLPSGEDAWSFHSLLTQTQPCW